MGEAQQRRLPADTSVWRDLQAIAKAGACTVNAAAGTAVCRPRTMVEAFHRDMGEGARRTCHMTSTAWSIKLDRHPTGRTASGVRGPSRRAGAMAWRTNFPPSSAESRWCEDDRCPGRAHRRADARGGAGAGQCRRRAGDAGHVAQRGRDRAARRADRRHRHAPARGRRDPADPWYSAGEAACGPRCPGCRRRPVRNVIRWRFGRRARSCVAAPAA